MPSTWKLSSRLDRTWELSLCLLNGSVENPDVVQMFSGNTDHLEHKLEHMGRHKFKFVISMQQFTKFNKEERKNASLLLHAYPDLQIAYLNEAPGTKGSDPKLYSVLIDGHSELDEATGKRHLKFRIELPGNPILGDGKLDNQNHAIIFYCGEYLQLITPVKTIILRSEFSSQSPYVQWGHKEFKSPLLQSLGPNIGVLGDIAAGKEQTFGTMTARTLAWIGGKLHYGHPDFLNATFMTTRGSVSKAQKGLHLNEDIFADVNAFDRGSRIKHSEYYQCGKGHDLSFGKILNFQMKIGTGMGEQMLSREYYYLGTQLLVDHFLTFYYGYPRFHINNILSILRLVANLLIVVFISILNKQLAICKVNSQGNVIGGQGGCHDLIPVFDWSRSSLYSYTVMRQCSGSCFLIRAINHSKTEVNFFLHTFFFKV
ncbi:1,3-beta-glucan synthase component-domain-containing protein [Lactarius deliciosus]|nr:1,3-beta-glucan synthase component-domain-containing protein [Lactarius deliciosus]